jgi:micrococcal nuclease
VFLSLSDRVVEATSLIGLRRGLEGPGTGLASLLELILGGKSMRRVFLVFPLVALVLVGLLFSEDQKRPEIPKRDFAGKTACEVTRVVDGNTLQVSVGGKDTKVRLIGIESPRSTEAYGSEAAQFLRNLLQGEHVWLEFEGTTPEVDSLGRTLAYLYRAPDGLFVNLEVVRQGYGTTNAKIPFRHLDLFTYYERTAREWKRGVWSLATPPTDPKAPTPEMPKDEGKKPDGGTSEPVEVTVYSTDSGTKYHADGCRYLAKSKHAISLKDALARGLGPCSVCKPPTR